MAKKTKVKYPNLRQASQNIGYNFSYIWRVLEGKPGYSGRKGLKEEFWAESHRLTAANKKAKGGKSA